MRQRAFILILASAWVGLPAAVHAGGKGTTAAPFLKVPINARAVGLAGSFTAVSGDATALEYNPASLAGLRRTDITFTYIDFLESTSFESAVVGFPFSIPGRQSSGATENTFDVRRAATAVRYNQFKASDEGRDVNSVQQGGINIQDQLFHFGLAVPVNPVFALGVGVKAIHQTLASESGSTYAFDTGLLWMPSSLHVGASILNVGPSEKLGDGSDPLPALVRVGVSRPVKDFLLVADATRGRDTVTRVSAGGEWTFKQHLMLRGGVFHESDLGFTAGLGFMFQGPQKAPPSFARRAQRPAHGTQLVFNERRAADLLDRLNFLATDLTQHFQSTGRQPSDQQLAVIPVSGVGDRMGPALADLLGQQFYQQNAFHVIERSKIESALHDTKIQVGAEMDDAGAAAFGRLVGATVIAVSQVTKGPSSYHVRTRLVTVDDATSQATASAELPADVFSVESNPALPPAAAPTASPGHMDIGFDYGLTSQGDFGFTHTLSLRLLY